jgi:hypothetical protein
VSSAGRTVRAASIAARTAATPPYPIERRKLCWKNSSEASEAATISPENSTVRPAVAMVAAMAALTCSRSVPGYLASSSRNLLTTNSA